MFEPSATEPLAASQTNADSKFQGNIQGNIVDSKPLPYSFARQLKSDGLNDESYYLDLPDKRVLVNRMDMAANSGSNTNLGSNKSTLRGLASSLRVFYFVDSKGSITFEMAGDQIVEARIHEVDEQRTFLGKMNGNGLLEFVEEAINSYICVDYERVPASSGPVALNADVDLVGNPNAVTLTEVSSLESRPGSARVVFIDYWGGVVSGTQWNADYNNGQDIPYEPYDSNNNPAFSQTELVQMYVGWAEMAEDYAPFDVNITTDISVFNSAAVNRRSRIIATPSCEWFGCFGGVAYVGVFGHNSNYNTVGWSWNTGFFALGMTHSHEAGHQMGLSHDGIAGGAEYYGGHSNWGSIMGGPFGKDYVQWSKGDYSAASNQQDDLIIIKARLNEVPDDAADTKANATAVNAGGAQLTGLITPQGLGTDTDVYTFQQGVTSDVQVTVRSAIEGLATNTGANLSMRAVLTNSANTVIAQAGPTNRPDTNILDFDAQLTPGTYYITITNESPNTNSQTGFNEYGNGGYYELSIGGGFTASNPDLRVAGVTMTPSSVAPGSDQIARVSGSIENIGFNTATDYTVKFYRSTDTSINTSDIEIDSVSTSVNLTSGQTSSIFTSTFAVPEEAGDYYYGLCVSSVNPTPNNCSAAQLLKVADEELCFPVKGQNGTISIVCL